MIACGFASFFSEFSYSTDTRGVNWLCITFVLKGSMKLKGSTQCPRAITQFLNTNEIHCTCVVCYCITWSAVYSKTQTLSPTMSHFAYAHTHRAYSWWNSCGTLWIRYASHRTTLRKVFIDYYCIFASCATAWFIKHMCLVNVMPVEVKTKWLLRKLNVILLTKV